MDKISQPRNQEKLTVNGNAATFTTGWLQWFKEVWTAINALMDAINAMPSAAVRASFTLSFINVPLAGNLALTAPAPGAQVGDFVQIQPNMSVVGLIFSGAVLTADVVTVYAQNYTTDSQSSGSVSFEALFTR